MVLSNSRDTPILPQEYPSSYWLNTELPSLFHWLVQLNTLVTITDEEAKHEALLHVNLNFSIPVALILLDLNFLFRKANIWCYTYSCNTSNMRLRVLAHAYVATAAAASLSEDLVTSCTHFVYTPHRAPRMASPDRNCSFRTDLNLITERPFLWSTELSGN
jgi:hypothetical protein